MVGMPPSQDDVNMLLGRRNSTPQDSHVVNAGSMMDGGNGKFYRRGGANNRGIGGFFRRICSARSQWQTVIAVVAILLLAYFVLDYAAPSMGEAPLAGSAAPNAAGKSNPNRVYGIIFDAGSSGSRVHVYEFDKMPGGQFNLIKETFEQLKPGLSSFAKSDADIERSAKDNLTPLLDVAMSVVPANKRASTPIVLRATAGLRLIGEEKANRILQKVRELFRQYPFKFGDDAVSIMDGDDEGLYAWVTVNYLRGQIGNDAMHTSGVLDLGGGSTQIAFAITDEEAKLVPEYVHKRKFGTTRYNLYVHSYLNYGLNSAREVMLGKGANSNGVCLPPEYEGNWHDLTLVAKEDDNPSDNDQECAVHVLSTMFQKAKCPVDTCAIKGTPQPAIGERDFHAFSFYYDRAIDVGLLEDGVEGQILTPRMYKDTAKNVCPLPLTDITKGFKVTEAQDAPFQCIDHTYIYNLLHNLGFQDDAPLRLTKKINGVETGWCLGAMIQELMSR